MSYEIKGNIEYIGNAQRFSENFIAREFVIETKREWQGKEFLDYVKFQLANDKCDLVNGMELGDEVRVSFNVGGRKHNHEGEFRYYTDLKAWKIEKD
jgi:hypothetical protein